MFKYKPTYTWPNPAFPFRVYYNGPECRVFIIENIQHNWNWLSEYSRFFKKTDYFFVYCGWYHSHFFAKQAEQIFDELELSRDNFFFLFNEASEMDNFTPYGFKGDVINQNAWLDENMVMKVLPERIKQYDGIYVGRFSAFKRHYLAEKINNLALVAGNNHGNAKAEGIPNAIYINEAPLTPPEVCMKINNSRCGLILSEEEGACFASSEYLLCGIPVVSTKSRGGRAVWYNSYNSILCDDTPDSVKDAVDFFVNNPRDPHIIRDAHISLAKHYRTKFISVFAKILYDNGVYNIDASEYFYKNFIHKLRKSHIPNFEKIFRNTNCNQIL